MSTFGSYFTAAPSQVDFTQNPFRSMTGGTLAPTGTASGVRVQEAVTQQLRQSGSEFFLVRMIRGAKFSGKRDNIIRYVIRRKTIQITTWTGAHVAGERGRGGSVFRRIYRGKYRS